MTMFEASTFLPLSPSGRWMAAVEILVVVHPDGAQMVGALLAFLDVADPVHRFQSTQLPSQH
jgi:hypothetical protein